MKRNPFSVKRVKVNSISTVSYFAASNHSIDPLDSTNTISTLKDCDSSEFNTKRVYDGSSSDSSECYTNIDDSSNQNDYNDQVDKHSDNESKCSLDDTREMKSLLDLPAAKISIQSLGLLDLLNTSAKIVYQALNEPFLHETDKHQLVKLLTCYKYSYNTSPQQQHILKQALTVRLKSAYHTKELEYFKTQELQFKQSFSHLYSNLEFNPFWYQNTVFVCKFTIHSVNVYAYSKGLLEILEKQGIRNKIVDERMLKVEDVHSFYDYLFSWQDLRIDFRVASLPILISPTMFPGCSIQIAKIQPLKMVKKVDGSTVYVGSIQGCIPDWNLTHLVNMLKDKECQINIDYIGK